MVLTCVKRIGPGDEQRQGEQQEPRRGRGQAGRRARGARMHCASPFPFHRRPPPGKQFKLNYIFNIISACAQSVAASAAAQRTAAEIEGKWINEP